MNAKILLIKGIGKPINPDTFAAEVSRHLQPTVGEAAS